MASTIKLRITDLGGAVSPMIAWQVNDGFGNYTKIAFYFVYDLQNPIVPNPYGDQNYYLERGNINNFNQALKDAIDAELVPSGDWSTSIDQYYLYINCEIPGSFFYPYVITNTLVYTYQIDNEVAEGIEIIQGIDNKPILNAYNHNVIIFRAGQIQKINVLANGELPATLYPSPNGDYYLDLKDFSTALINDNKFADTIIPNIESEGYVYVDESLFLTLELNFSALNFSAKSIFYFLKSVGQIANYSDKLITESYILLPKYGLSHRATYYEGYPFDIPIYSDVLRSVVVKNKTTGHNVQLDFQQRVNRLFFSQGSENFTIEDVMPMQSGINRLELDFGTKQMDLIINKKESLCAPYFKFYRNSGGWGYIRFLPEVQIKDKAVDGKDVRVDFNGIHNTLTRFLNEGKETTVEMECYTELLEPWEMENFKDFQKSPRVEMYVSDLFQKQTAKSWVGVSVKSNSLETTKRKTKLNRERVKIEFTEYNLHL